VVETVIGDDYQHSTSVIDAAVLGVALRGDCELRWFELHDQLGSHQPGGFGIKRLSVAVDRLVEAGYLQPTVDDLTADDYWLLRIPLPATAPVEEVR
jgi:hypothetical protein